MNRYRLAIVIGTRPEAIKLAPVVFHCRRHSNIVPVVIVTGQHDALLEPVLSFFEIVPDIRLNVMVPGQSLAMLTARLLTELDPLIDSHLLNGIVSQGDTTSAMAAAMVGFYRKCHVFHVEAGLRTDDLYAPFPEEFNRRVIDDISSAKFAPTTESLQRLLSEGKGAHSVCVGNTVIDALHLGLSLIHSRGTEPYSQWMADLGCGQGRPLILVTTHRRENAGKPLIQICDAILELVSLYPDLDIALPVHCNPEFYSTIYDRLGTVPQVKLLEPLPYDKLLWLMTQSTLVLTDSGGLQEEAPSLNKPVLIMRDVTERPEGVSAGCAKLVGTDREKIVNSIQELLNSTESYHAMADAKNPYGDGTASKLILDYINDHFVNGVLP